MIEQRVGHIQDFMKISDVNVDTSQTSVNQIDDHFL